MPLLVTWRFMGEARSHIEHTEKISWMRERVRPQNASIFFTFWFINLLHRWYMVDLNFKNK